jgi:hypothetical protein
MLRNGWFQRGAFVLVGIMLTTTQADAKRTKLREVDLKTGRARSIDGGGPRTKADRALDSLLDSATGSAFSTKDLAKIDKALRRYLRAARPRAMPRLLLFLYPGRISKAGLKELREVLVDLDLVVDPCGRTVCRESVGKTLELLGKSLRQAVIRTRKYTIRFKTVTIRTVADLRGSHPETYRFGADEVVRSGHRTGGGHKLVRRLTSAKKGYVAAMTKEVSRSVKRRRVALLGAPKIHRSARSVSVAMEIKSDRTRYKSHVGKAFVGAAQALGKNPLTPPNSSLKVVARIRFRKVQRRTFSCMGQPLKLHLDGRITTSELWDSYINELGKKGTRMTFSDEEASGGVSSDDSDSGEDRTQEILAAHFNMLAPCLQAEVKRNRRFRGVTMKFTIGSSGKAGGVGTKERVSSRLKRCLKSALGKIRFQRQRGTPRRVEYPMYIQR